jgi:hypothetical protein
MAVVAGLVAELADVDLQDRDSGCAEWEQSGLIQPKIEWWRGGRLAENPKLFSR